MRIEIDTTAGQCRVRDATDLKRLDAIIIGGSPAGPVLGNVGRLDDGGTHLWVDRDALARLCGTTDRAWRDGFDAMLAYAASKGWMDEDNRMVRVHLIEA